MSALVFLHGWGFTPRIWAPLRAQLGDEPCLAPPVSAGPASLALRADTLAAHLPRDSLLIGWSLGAMLALQTAQRHPEKVRALCLIGASPRFVASPDWPHGLDAATVDAFADGFERDPQRTRKRFMALQVLGDVQRKPLQLALDAAQADVTTPGLRQGLEILSSADLRPLVPEIAQPTMLVHGAQDALMPIEAARWLARTLPAASLTEVAGAGHCPGFLEPEMLAEIIRRFAHGH